MIIDLVALALLGLSTWLGHYRGLASQLGGAAAIVGVYLFAPLVSPLTQSMIWGSEVFMGIEVLSLAITGVVLFIAFFLVMRIFAEALVAMSGKFEAIDAFLGAILGFAKGFLIIYLILCGFHYARGALKKHMPGFGEVVEASYLTAAAGEANILTWMIGAVTGDDEEGSSSEGASDLSKALVAAEESEGKGERNEALERLMKNEDFQSVMKDEALMEAAKNEDYGTLLTDTRVLRLLADEDFRTVLTETDWDALSGD